MTAPTDSQKPSTPRREDRTLPIAEHLWEALEQMAREMGVERAALVNQAIFTFARLNGYVVPGRTAAALPVRSSPPTEEPSLPAAAPLRSPTLEVGNGVPRRRPGESGNVGVSGVHDLLFPSRRTGNASPPVADLQGLDAAWGAEGPTAGLLPASVEKSASESQVGLRTEVPFETGVDPSTAVQQRQTVDSSADGAAEGEGEVVLVLHVKDQLPTRVGTERYLIGRGKHCDLVIDSNRVSREHAVIVRDGNELWIEDLRSSNGTWLDRQKITRRKIQNGDEYVLGTERVVCTLTRELAARAG